MDIPEHITRQAIVNDEITRQLVAEGMLEDAIKFMQERTKGQYQNERDEFHAVAMFASKIAGVALARGLAHGRNAPDVGFLAAVRFGASDHAPRMGSLLQRHYLIEVGLIARDRFGLEVVIKDVNGHE
jgi:hypothetical protein